MPWGGNGVFSRVFSWVADKAAGLDISSTRMDTDTDDIATNGFGNCLTRDGQGQPTANLPMAGFRHTGVQNAQNRTDYAAFGQVQDGLSNWTIAGGTSDALTATYTPALQAINDGQLCFVRAAAANATTTPTFAPNGLTPEVITKQGGVALAIGDIPGNLAEIVLRYNLANTRWELLNPAFLGGTGTGDVKPTLKTVADPGWLMFNDSTFGSAGSGAASASAANQSLFLLLFANISDTAAPLLTSGGAGTTRAAQGTAAQAWAANCRMTLPLTLGRALAVAGTGGGLTARALGATFGEETHLLATTELPAHSHANTLTDPGHSHSTSTPIPGGGSTFDTWNTSTVGTNATAGAPNTSGNTTGITINNVNAGGGGAHNNIQPSTYMNMMVKL
jgi:microcystin-dependent protein